ncbi:hypothetical protein CDAR_515361 [Caerostris darwini]|uniref:Uncharacterized protein n=1 Tax=Caerostris darwini TaxID=1538125 RepID=A0AAV4PNF4_9ARAC|nr:hypothetical protein CDAR_515361 [Caerostris darwini]
MSHGLNSQVEVQVLTYPTKTHVEIKNSSEHFCRSSRTKQSKKLPAFFSLSFFPRPLSARSTEKLICFKKTYRLQHSRQYLVRPSENDFYVGRRKIFCSRKNAPTQVLSRKGMGEGAAGIRMDDKNIES